MLSHSSAPRCSPFVFKDVTETEIFLILKSISTKAVGSDGINIHMLQLLSTELAPIITHMINFL